MHVGLATRLERAPYFGETRLTIRERTWKSLDRETVDSAPFPADLNIPLSGSGSGE